MNFGILVFDGVEELDFVGPWEILKIWSKIADGPENCFIVGESQTAISCARGLSVKSYCQIWCMGIKPRSCLIDPVLARRP